MVTSQDRFEMTNLASEAAHAPVLQRLAAALDRTLQEQGDPGIPLDTPAAHRAAASGNPLFPSKP